MKKPEEIKKGLEYASTTNIARKVAIAKAGRMPYEYVEEAAADALAYIQQLESRLAQVERERDAAMDDARLGTACDTCFYNENPHLLHKPCDYCAGGFPMWQWRGVCPENTKEE